MAFKNPQEFWNKAGDKFRAKYGSYATWAAQGFPFYNPLATASAPAALGVGGSTLAIPETQLHTGYTYEAGAGGVALTQPITQEKYIPNPPSIVSAPQPSLAEIISPKPPPDISIPEKPLPTEQIPVKVPKFEGSPFYPTPRFIEQIQEFQQELKTAEAQGEVVLIPQTQQPQQTQQTLLSPLLLLGAFILFGGEF